MISTLIALYFFIAGLTAEYVSNTFKQESNSANERWCLSFFCGLMWPLIFVVYFINRW